MKCECGSEDLCIAYRVPVYAYVSDGQASRVVVLTDQGGVTGGIARCQTCDRFWLLDEMPDMGTWPAWTLQQPAWTLQQPEPPAEQGWEIEVKRAGRDWEPFSALVVSEEQADLFLFRAWGVMKRMASETEWRKVASDSPADPHATALMLSQRGRAIAFARWREEGRIVSEPKTCRIQVNRMDGRGWRSWGCDETFTADEADALLALLAPTPEQQRRYARGKAVPSKLFRKVPVENGPVVGWPFPRTDTASVRPVHSSR